ncbi:MAG: hypothetical protein RR602_09065 [Longicatena sp.]
MRQHKLDWYKDKIIILVNNVNHDDSRESFENEEKLKDAYNLLG